METVIGVVCGGVVTALLIGLIVRTRDYPYSYHVVYQFKSEANWGHGSMTVSRKRKLDSSDEIKNVKNFIEEENKVTNVVITNFIRLG